MKINGIETNADKFAYDGCHKIYLIEDDNDLKDAKRIGYSILNIEMIEKIYLSSCGLKFIHNWKLDKEYVPQFTENVVFEF